ncbi:hypothetical protein RF11_15785 [Thelohanellus kitauei]|uniref:Uncharacterized protein n=1 Tax=Thelohanellus kitauei TaxID=669202 RepID=A0A0C2JA06_THEKT|nr:hypothetical protein RF11_15785 [Thelohanellus kitauei]
MSIESSTTAIQELPSENPPQNLIGLVMNFIVKPEPILQPHQGAEVEQQIQPQSELQNQPQPESESRPQQLSPRLPMVIMEHNGFSYSGLMLPHEFTERKQ